MRRVVLGFSAAVALLATCGAGAGAASYGSPSTYSVAVTQAIFDRAGNPSLTADFSPDGSLATPSWAVCPPDSASCAPAGVTSRTLTPGPTAPGTVFEAIASYGGTTYTALSPTWQGTVASTASPTLSGAARVGATVTPHGGSWSGGWGGELDVLHVEACRTADGRDCTTIAHPRASSGPRRSLAINPLWSGRYLFAFDERFARGTIFPAIGSRSPASIPPSSVGPTVARSAPLGPVAGPALTLREHPLLRDGRLLLGRATCTRGCRVVVTVTASGSAVGSAMRIHGTKRLAVPAHSLHLDGHVRLRVQLGSTPPVVRSLSGRVVTGGTRARG